MRMTGTGSLLSHIDLLGICRDGQEESSSYPDTPLNIHLARGGQLSVIGFVLGERSCFLSGLWRFVPIMWIIPM